LRVQTIVNDLLTKAGSSRSEVEINMGKALFMFCVADLKKNEVYNHYAFELIQGLVIAVNKGLIKDLKRRFAIGILLQKCVDWGYMRVDLKQTMQQLDGLCLSLLSNKNIKFTIPAAWIVLYLYERVKHGSIVSFEACSQAMKSFRISAFGETGVVINTDEMNFDLRQNVYNALLFLGDWCKLNFQLNYLQESITTKIPQKANQQSPFTNENILDQSFEQLVAFNQEYNQQRSFYKSLI
jgi:hypothetical protein